MLRLLKKYLAYYFRSTNEHGIHSPFVFSLVTKIIYSKREYYSYREIDAARYKLLKNNKEITILDLGAGSKVNSSRKRKISDIARHSAKPAKYGKLLFRLTDHFQPSTILELGTSLGISTLYMASAKRTARMITIEGCPETAKIAQENLNKTKLDNVTLLVGDFNAQLPAALDELKKIDLAFFDGNHRKEATLNYFQQVLPYTHNNSVLIFDDIHWSDEMEEAWEAIKAHPAIHVTIDLYFLGIVFFRQEQREEHFVVRF
jgi:predicted O-methyltransferase YrrM